jgi:hypothetical protein
MNIPLSNFEDYIDEKILKKGIAYALDGKVGQVEELADNKFKVPVYGSEEYTVEMELEDDIVTSYKCNCPYDAGPVCKHIASVIFSLQDSRLTIKENEENPDLDEEMDDLEEMLENASKEELVTFIMEVAKEDELFRHYATYVFDDSIFNEVKENYQEKLQLVYRSASGKDGFIEANETHVVANAGQKFVDEAYDLYEETKVFEAVSILLAVMEEMCDAFQFADDTGGKIDSAIKSAYDLLKTIIVENGDEVIRNYLFDYCLHAYKTKRFFGLEWHIQTLYACAYLAENKDDAETIIELLNQHPKEDLEEDIANRVKYEMINRVFGKAEGEKFLKSIKD